MLVRDRMSTSAVTVRSDDDYKSALHIMQENALHHLPVVDGDQRLLGIIAESDIFRILVETLDQKKHS